jgi:hypothetical protein
MFNKKWTVLIILTFLASSLTAEEPRKLIEKHLGVSDNAWKILQQHLFDVTSERPDMAYIHEKLAALGDMRNLTVGILMMEDRDELQRTPLKDSLTFQDFRPVFDSNTTGRGTTLVRPSDITAITIQTNTTDMIVGAFDWVIPQLLQGRCRFVIRGDNLEYLGILRKNPVDVYDCYTIFSAHGDLVESQEWYNAKYYLIVTPVNKYIKELTRRKQMQELDKLLHMREAYALHWLFLSDTSVPLVYVGSLSERDRIKAILDTHHDWKVLGSGRAITTTLTTFQHSIAKQRPDLFDLKQDKP